MKTFNFLNRPLLIAESACNQLAQLEWIFDCKRPEILNIQNGLATITIHGVLTRRDEGFLNTVS